MPRPIGFLLLLASLVGSLAGAQDPPKHGRQYDKLLIRDVMLVDGSGKPMRGPTNIVVEKDRITRIGGPARGGSYDAVIDGEGLTAIPGLVNLHGHLQDGRAGIDMPYQLQLNLWLASGITSVRDLSSDRQEAVEMRADAAAGKIACPRLFLYMWCGGDTAERALAMVDAAHEMGADGIKLTGTQREPLLAVFERAKKLELPIAHHIGVEDADVRADIEAGATRTVEHWYGIPDAAIPYGSQQFPADYNYSNELDRFRWAGRLWREADSAYLSEVLQGMVDAGIAWDPTLAIYEACRDATRAQNQPWFEDYLHPAMEAFFEPNLSSHGSFFLDWTTADEIAWKENYRLWFAALREFAERGGIIGTGEDAGFIYRVHGFGLIRELELQQEAGFHPIDVLKHATHNGARILGQEDEFGRLRPGLKADIALVNGNPLRNFKLLYPSGTRIIEDGESKLGGKVAWTLKDGRCYDCEVLREEARTIVRDARAERANLINSKPEGGD